MKKTKLTRSLMAAVSVVALSAVMYGCTHSGSDPVAEPPPPPPPAAVDLMGSTDLMPGTTMIAAGASVTVGNTTITCTGDADCALTVMKDAVTGAYSATATGGTVTVAYNPPPPPVEPTVHTVDLMGSMDLMPGTRMMEPGESFEVGDTTVTCPEGGEGCVLTVSEDPISGMLMATSTGAAATVAYDPPAPPPTFMVTLPDGHGLADGMTTIQPGGTVMLPGGTHITCPEGGEACVLTVSTDVVTGARMASSTGAMAMVTTQATRDAAEEERKRQELADAEQAVKDRQADLDAAEEAYNDGSGTRNAVDLSIGFED